MEYNNVNLFLPPYLQKLGYNSIPSIIELGKRAVIIYESHIYNNRVWSGWRGIFEYISCVEHAHFVLYSLSEGREIGSHVIVPARYNSASLVFFSQATLDNVAVWLAQKLDIKLKGGDCSFHKTKFKSEVITKNKSFEGLFNNFNSFIEELNTFRQEWIHRLAGGANEFSNASPEDPNANIHIAVPINPAINFYELDKKKYLKMIENCRKKNKGRWLYPIREFADRMRDGTRDFCIAVLDISLSVIH